MRRNNELPPTSGSARGGVAWWATWVCDKDPAHIGILLPSEERAVLMERNRRYLEQSGRDRAARSKRDA